MLDPHSPPQNWETLFYSLPSALQILTGVWSSELHLWCPSDKMKTISWSWNGAKWKECRNPSDLVCHFLAEWHWTNHMQKAFSVYCLPSIPVLGMVSSLPLYLPIHRVGRRKAKHTFDFTPHPRLQMIRWGRHLNQDEPVTSHLQYLGMDGAKALLSDSGCSGELRWY